MVWLCINSFIDYHLPNLNKMVSKAGMELKLFISIPCNAG